MGRVPLTDEPTASDPGPSITANPQPRTRRAGTETSALRSKLQRRGEMNSSDSHIIGMLSSVP